MSAPCSSPRHALHLLLRVNDTLEQILSERSNLPHRAEPKKNATPQPPSAEPSADACPKCGQEIEEGQLVTSDFKRHISCPEIAAYETAA